MIEIVKPQSGITDSGSLGTATPSVTSKNLLAWSGNQVTGTVVLELRSDDLQTVIQTFDPSNPVSGLYVFEIVAPDDAVSGDRYKLVITIDGSVDDIRDAIIVDKVTS